MMLQPVLGWEVKEMTSVRPISSSRSLIAAGGAGVEMQAPRRQVGVAVALVLFAASHYWMYRIPVPVPTSITRRRLQLRIFLLSGDTTTYIYH